MTAENVVFLWSARRLSTSTETFSAAS